MKYSDINKFMSDATHIYAGVTLEEQDAMTQNCWAIEMDGVKYVGTSFPAEQFALKELVNDMPQPVVVSPPEDLQPVVSSEQTTDVQADTPAATPHKEQTATTTPDSPA